MKLSIVPILEKRGKSLLGEFSDHWRIFFQIVVLLYVIYYIVEEIRQFIRDPKDYITSFWNILDSLSYILILVIIPLHVTRSSVQFIIASIVSIILWLKVLFFARGHPALGPFVRMVIQISLELLDSFVDHLQLWTLDYFWFSWLLFCLDLLLRSS